MRIWAKPVPPLFNTLKHQLSTVCCAILAHMTLSRMVHDTIDDSVQSALNVLVLVIPSSHELGDDPGHNLAGRLSGYLVEDLGNGQHIEPSRSSVN